MEGGGKKLHPSITYQGKKRKGMEGWKNAWNEWNEWSSPPFINKTQPGVRSDIFAIKAIRFLLALPVW